MSGDTTYRGAGSMAWMARNAVAANLIMVVLIVGGLMMVGRVRQEVMPEFQLNLVTIAVPYPGASPAEVEQGIVLAVEEAVRGLDGIKEVTAVASEGAASITVELEESANGYKLLQDIKNSVDRITSFPQDAERPIVQLLNNRREVISLVLYGEIGETELRALAEDVRDRMLLSKNITEVNLIGVRPMEISIEIPQETLRAHDLTLQAVADIIRRTAIELPAGGIKTRGGEILLRTAERRDRGREYADIAIVSRADGSTVRLGDIATLTDGFRDTDQAAYFGDQRAVRLSVSRVGDQKPLEIAAQVKELATQLESELPPGLGVAVWYDASEMFADRLDLLARNAAMGLCLVLLVLGLFLEIRLAFWVMMGIPISMLGAFLVFPQFGVSINMISLFAFIITLGIVVDDAVVVGENIYELREKGLGRMQAAVEGVKGVVVPVVFSVLTNIISFIPLLFVPGTMGKFFKVIPITVISVFAISLIESLFVLPAHLAHQKPSPQTGYRAALRRGQRRIGALLERFSEVVYQPLLRLTLRHVPLTVSIGVAILILAFGIVGSGKIRFTFMPKIDTDLITANAALAFGAPPEDTREISRKLVAAAQQVIDEHGGAPILRGILTDLGASVQNARSGGGTSASGSHLTSVSVYLVSSNLRSITASEFAALWRAKVANLTGLETLTFQYSTGPAAGNAINIQLAHKDIKVLETAASELAGELGKYAGVKDIDDGFELGKPQYDFKLKPEARAMGLTAAEMGNQMRSAFYGARAFRQQRGREEIWVMVRLPVQERQSAWNVKAHMVRTPSGAEIPLEDAVEMRLGHAYTQIKRVNGRRVVNVKADVNIGEANANEVIANLAETALPKLLRDHAGLSYSLEGDSRNQGESLASLKQGFIMALLGIFALLAIPLRSYVQPIIIMLAIPFGVIGAIGGHLLLGYDLSMISMMGMVALSGVVVNDSLVLIHAVNEFRSTEGLNLVEALVSAGTRRLRPILLTSLTTFFGLMPMIFETSVQARFLIPMAISLGFGIIASTLLTLLLVPAFYVIAERLKDLFVRNNAEPVGDLAPR